MFFMVVVLSMVLFLILNFIGFWVGKYHGYFLLWGDPAKFFVWLYPLSVFEQSICTWNEWILCLLCFNILNSVLILFSLLALNFWDLFWSSTLIMDLSISHVFIFKNIPPRYIVNIRGSWMFYAFGGLEEVSSIWNIFLFFFINFELAFNR